ncbi:MAG: carboxypeptidase, partial [Armatimonadota bacterium]
AHPYDALLDLFEPKTTLREVQGMFDGLATPLRTLVDRARDDAPTALDAGWSGEAEAIRHAMVGICTTMGLSPGASRIDLATSAFCSGTSRGDSRLTTRASDALKGVLSSTLHEMGHALYALNIARELDGTPLSYGHGLAAHESQSRLWENMVGRSRGFWTFALPRLAESFPRLANLKVNDAVRSANRVRPEAIRVGSDELTYNLHILVRFELEVALVEGSLEVKNLPEAWNDAYERHLGLRPASDQEGVLQDVHWSRGSVGYFPTYAMGNIVGGSLWKELNNLGDLDAQFAQGEFTPVREWLTERVYRHGSGRFAREITEIGGATYLDPAPWLEYAEAKFG